MSENARKPGVMVYFDIRPAIQRLTLEERGALFTAILDFAENGVVPELDGMAGMCFDLMRPKIERDGEHYEEIKAQRRYATYCREVKKAGGTPVSFEEWLSSDNHSLSGDVGRYPTTTATATASTTATTTTTPTTTTSTAGASTATAEGKAEGLSRGTGGEPRSDEEFERLRQKQLALLKEK